jgi:zinc finger SWIM domain-containing protein 3
MKSVQQKESLTSELKKHLSLECDLLNFFEQFERLLCDRQSTEMEAEPRDHFVKFDSLNSTMDCTCKTFELIGIPCRHMLEVLDMRNIKDLPTQSP